MAGDTRFYFLHDFSMWVREAALSAPYLKRFLTPPGGHVGFELGADGRVVLRSDQSGEFIGDGECWAETSPRK